MTHKADPAAGPVGILGGTFDPLHFGHLRLAEEAREALSLHTLRLVPAGQPPHRATPRTPAAMRLEMVRLAIAGNAALEVDASEVRAQQTSYTVLTLERLRAALGPARPLVLLLGADAFEGLPGWHQWQRLFELAHIGVANRPGYAPHGRRWPIALSPELDAACAGRIERDPSCLQAAPAGCVVPFDMTPLAISASLIRDLVAAGHSARYLVPDAVLDYSRLHQLYH
jgi:nicotinate-nucleotide adenylyltransferase